MKLSYSQGITIIHKTFVNVDIIPSDSKKICLFTELVTKLREFLMVYITAYALVEKLCILRLLL
jgi:hypothetical protein